MQTYTKLQIAIELLHKDTNNSRHCVLSLYLFIDDWLRGISLSILHSTVATSACFVYLRINSATIDKKLIQTE